MLRDLARGRLAWLLGLANAHSGHSLHGRAFYDLKDRLLRRYGQPAGEDVQRIVQPCWGDDEDSGCLGRRCRRCGGTGVWDTRLVLLERWALGGRVFHRPARRVWGAEWEARVSIEGRIRHADVSPRASAESVLWLALLFDRRLFRLLLTASRHMPWPWQYPMLALQSVAFTTWSWFGRLRPHRRWCSGCHRLFRARGSRWACYRCAPPWAPAAPAHLDDDLPF